METTVLKKKSGKQFVFQVPTEITQLEPVFVFTLNGTDRSNFNEITIDVALNPKLTNASLNKPISTFRFNESGNCRIKREWINDFFIEGDIKLLDQEETSFRKPSSCFVNITYGNREEALHFIKGTFNF